MPRRRAQAVTMLVRLLGKEAEAKADTWTVPFSDLADWARPYVGYAYANGLTNGLSAERFGSDDKVTANQYLTFILRALGYSSERDFQWDKANAFSDSLGLTHGEYRASRSFTRGDTARISYAALAQARKDSSETLAAQLVRQGAVKAKTAAECGLVLAADSGGFLNIAGSRYTLQNADGCKSGSMTSRLLTPTMQSSPAGRRTVMFISTCWPRRQTGATPAKTASFKSTPTTFMRI